MTWSAPEPTRPDPPLVAGEREALEGWLEYHRATLLHKCAGLTGGQLVERAVAPSSLSLLGLVRHMSEVERGWFRKFAGGQSELGDIYCTEDHRDADFDLTESRAAEADLATFVAECALATAAVAGTSLDDTFTNPRSGNSIDLRWVYIHMIEEYARHNGHADILREQIDGATGD